MNLVKKNPYIFIIGAILVASMFFLFGIINVKANPSEFCTKSTSGATTSPVYMIAGVATTTHTIDNCTNNVNGADSALVMLQMTSTNSPTTLLQYRYEFSQNKVDWYPENVRLNDGSPATTTPTVTGSPVYNWYFGSTTPITGGTSDIARKAIEVPMPARYTRIQFYLPIGNSPIDFYAESVVKRQRFE